MAVGCHLSKKKRPSVLCWYVENILEEDTRLGEQRVLWVGPCTPSALPRAVPCEVLAVPKSLF